MYKLTKCLFSMLLVGLGISSRSINWIRNCKHVRWNIYGFKLYI